MKAIRVTEFGGTEVLRLEDVEKPVPGPGEALVRIHAAGLNFIDIYQRRGELGMRVPYIPGREGAGVVESVGESVTEVKPGDRVAFLSSLGSYAEYGAVPVSGMIRIPEDLSFEQAAAVALQGMTAHYLIHEYREVKPGITVLIHAAAGGMGLLLVQWAHHLGARVIGTVSTEEKALAAREAGADEVILYSQTDWVAEVNRITDGKGIDLIIDGVGETTFAGNLKAAAIRGNIVIYGAASGPADPIAPNSLQGRSLTISGGMLTNYLLTPEERDRRASDVLEGIRSGWLKLTIGGTFPLSKAAAAHQMLESRASSGKVILTT